VSEHHIELQELPVAMASREIPASAHEVYKILIDPHTYPHWLVGAKDIRDIDGDWPAAGSKFHHRVGAGPLTIPDSTKVLAAVADRQLVLAVRARPLVSAVATFTLVSDGAHCVVQFEEEPAQRLIGNIARPVLDPITHARNHESLKRLADYVTTR
jgi:uncharacterized protein YndB with AHSA1/START domain